MLRYLQPGRIRDAWTRIKSLRREGGPTRIELERLERPDGWLFPTSEATLDIEARSGAHVRLTPELPVPWPYAWGYRLARQLNLPLASTLEPQDIRLSLPVPDFIRRRLSASD